ncbi:MAG: hypothetical protein AAGF79_09880, partial [Pseudomonadota bacterium]
DGEDLVGFRFSEPLKFIVHGQPVRGLLSTLLSADPDRKGQGIAKQLAQELSRRIEDQDFQFDTGFGVPGPGSLGPGFWLGSQNGTRAVGVRPWIRPLDAQALVTSVGSKFERGASRLAASLGLDRLPQRKSPHVRPYRDADVGPCLDILKAAETGSDFRYEWSADRLAFQLDYKGIPSTWVYDDGTVRGFSNVHRQWFRGPKRFAAGQIDHLVAREDDPGVEKALMDHTLGTLQSTGHALAICPSSASTTVRTRLRSGFLPMPERYDFLFVFIAPGLDITKIRQPKVHLR